MKSNLLRLAAGLLALGVFAASAPAQYSIGNVIPNAYSGERNQQAEPGIALNPTNPKQIGDLEESL